MPIFYFNGPKRPSDNCYVTCFLQVWLLGTSNLYLHAVAATLALYNVLVLPQCTVALSVKAKS